MITVVTPGAVEVTMETDMVTAMEVEEATVGDTEIVVIGIAIEVRCPLRHWHNIGELCVHSYSVASLYKPSM